MTNRKPINKKMRFEIFKRDKFTCQYCGRKSPDVILEVDHIIPVAEGGRNDMLNLITSCRDCNRGKGKRKLNDNSEVERQRMAMEDAQDRKEQMRMMIQWRKELVNIEDEMIESINELWNERTGDYINENGRQKLRLFIKQYGFEEVIEATEIAIATYYVVGHSEYAFGKIGGILFNRKIGRTAEYYYAKQNH